MRRRNVRSRNPPLLDTLSARLGELSFNTQSRKASHVQFQYSLQLREEITGFRATIDESPNCHALRAAGQSASMLERYVQIGIYGGCCRHGLFSGLSMIGVKGEGLAFVHFLLYKAVHNSHTRINEAVFRPVPPDPIPQPEIVYTDSTCLLKSYLNNRDRQMLDYFKYCLGKVHENAHTCVRENTARGVTGSANSTGEMTEKFWPKIEGMAPLIENASIVTAHDDMNYAIAMENHKTQSRTVEHITQSFERALSEGFQYLGVLKDLIGAIARAKGGYRLKLSDVKNWQANLGTDSDVSQAPQLTRRANYFGLLDELEKLSVVQSALDAASMFGRILQSETSVASRISDVTRKLDSLRTTMQQYNEDNTVPTTEERQAFAAKKRWDLKASICNQEAKIYVLKGLMIRGRNHTLLHAKEKAAARRRTAKAVKRLEELRVDLGRWTLGYNTFADQEPPQREFPLELQLSVIAAYENILRRVEELYLCENEMASFIKHCSSISEKLGLEAEELRKNKSGSLEDWGRASVLARAAAERHGWSEFAEKTRSVSTAASSCNIESSLQKLLCP